VADKLYAYDVRFTTPSRHEEDPWTKKQHKELRIKLYRAMMEKYGRKLFMDQQPAWDT
jgi:hypothetical protein